MGAGPATLAKRNTTSDVAPWLHGVLEGSRGLQQPPFHGHQIFESLVCWGGGIGIRAGLRNQILRVRLPPPVPKFMWAGMFRGGDGPLQGLCGGFDSLPVHQVYGEDSVIGSTAGCGPVSMGSNPISHPK